MGQVCPWMCWGEHPVEIDGWAHYIYPCRERRPHGGFKVVRCKPGEDPARAATVFEHWAYSSCIEYLEKLVGE